jgi:molybdopterin/thiamine biosynthesis adenylyltransferase/rhodanese-related sulfurtransferase
MSTIETTPRLAWERQRAGALLVDVREPEEHALGVPAEALRVPRVALEARPAAVIPDQASEVLLICASGQRSLRAAEALRAHGYRNVQSVAGGCQAWLAEGLPFDARRDADFMERYSRHLRLPQVGLEGQEKLERARILLVGAGGLGSPAAFYLAAAGVGFLRLVDDDVVDRSNLQRQILHAEQRIGAPKVASATLALSALNPRVRIEPVQARVVPANVDALVADVDLVIDGADNFATRYLLSDACVQHRKPLVYGAVHRFDGQASVFDAGRRRGESPCYRCLFPEPPDAADAPNCAEAGVLGVLPGIIGLIQANEAIKLVLGIGDSLAGRLLQFDALGMRFHESRLQADPACPVCAPGATFPGYSVPGGDACRA